MHLTLQKPAPPLGDLSGGDLVPHVIQCLGEHRIRVTDFRTELPNLEDVFLKLTGHSIRE